MASDMESSASHSPLSTVSDAKSVETSKSELIKRILDSFKISTTGEPLSDRTTDIPTDEITSPCLSYETSNKIYLRFAAENELGIRPAIDDLLDKIDSTKNCSCHRMDISLENTPLNEQLSYRQKQSVLRVILRRQQLVHRYFSQFNWLTRTSMEISILRFALTPPSLSSTQRWEKTKKNGYFHVPVARGIIQLEETVSIIRKERMKSFDCKWNKRGRRCKHIWPYIFLRSFSILCEWAGIYHVWQKLSARRRMETLRHVFYRWCLISPAWWLPEKANSLKCSLHSNFFSLLIGCLWHERITFSLNQYGSR